MPLLPGISSMSLGRAHAGHTLSHKLTSAAQNGLRGIELFYDDLVAHATQLQPPSAGTAPSDEALLTAAHSIRTLCASLNLTIICLQPFMHYEGLRDRAAHAKRITEVKLWIRLAHALDTDIIQVPSTFLPASECTGDLPTIVSDLRELADLGLREADHGRPLIRFAYESLAWGTHVDKWETCWAVIQAVDRANFGACLDSFNILARIYADPAAASGCVADADAEVAASMERMVQQIAPFKEKIFFLQVVDAERLEAPLRPGHAFYNQEQPARMSWSRNCRLFYGEKEHGAYLPVTQVVDTIINRIGYDGWVSMELFNRVMERRDAGVVEELAGRAAAGWWKLVEDLGLEGRIEGVVGKEEGSTARKDSKDLDGLGEVARL